MSTKTNFLALSKPAAGDEDWTAEINANWDAISALSAPTNCFFVSPAFTESALGNSSAADRRHFPKIQEALDEIEVVGSNEQTTVFVYPGDYYESLSLASSVAIVSYFGINRMYGAGSVRIRGNNSASPVIRVQPPSGTAKRYSFFGIGFENQYNASDAVQHDCYLLSAERQVTIGSYPSTIDFRDCTVRAQTWGAHNAWTSMFDLDGYYLIRVKNCRFGALNYAGGYNDGGIGCFFRMRGWSYAAPVKACSAQIEDSIFYNASTISAYTRRIFDLNEETNGWFYRCASNDQRAFCYSAAGLGENLISGIESDGAAATYRNDFSLSIGGF